MSGDTFEQPTDTAPPSAPSSPSQEPTGGYASTASAPVDSSLAAEQQPYTYPPPPPPQQVWPPPPVSIYQTPIPMFPMPTNAVLILVLGIVSIAMTLLCGMGGLIGIIPWVMGNTSLRAIHQGQANPVELGTVNGGRICGIVGTILAALLSVFGLGILAFGLYSDHHR